MASQKSNKCRETVQQAQLLEESIVHTTRFVDFELDHWEMMRGLARKVRWQVVIDMARCKSMEEGGRI